MLVLWIMSRYIEPTSWGLILHKIWNGYCTRQCRTYAAGIDHYTTSSQLACPNFLSDRCAFTMLHISLTRRALSTKSVGDLNVGIEQKLHINLERVFV